MELVLIIGVGFGLPLVLTGGILYGVVAGVKRSIAAEAARLPGVELDSGPTTMTTRYRDFRSDRWVRLGGMRRNPVRAVLTATHLHLLERPQRYGVFARSDLSRFTVGIEEGKLRLHTDDPPGATGSVDYRLVVPDPEGWVRALVRSGATPAP